jgi:putative hydrolase of HD superfamily
MSGGSRAAPEASLRFLREADKLKGVVRQSRLSFDPARRENDAEHSWHLALMAVVLAEQAADPGLDLLRVLRMLLVHDIVEIDAGDTFLYDEQEARTQAEREAAAAARLFGLLEEPRRSELESAWEEFEARATPEARFARALDRVQPILQNLYTDGVSWRAHGVTAAQVRERNRAIVLEGAPALWPYLEALIDEAVRRGLLAGP